MPSATSYRKQISDTIENIEAINARAEQLWNRRGNYGPIKQAKSNSRIMEQRIRPLDLLRESLFRKLWALHEESNFEFSDMEEISREKKFNGLNDVTRVTYCDGQFHYVTNKKDEFQYGYVCTC